MKPANNQCDALQSVFPNGAEVLTVMHTNARRQRYLEHIYYDKPPAELRNKISIFETFPGNSFSD